MDYDPRIVTIEEVKDYLQRALGAAIVQLAKAKGEDVFRAQGAIQTLSQLQNLEGSVKALRQMVEEDQHGRHTQSRPA